MPETHSPLAGKTAVLACSELKSETLTAGLEALGARVITFPVISIRALADTSALDAALDNLGAYTWVVFTSGYGVQFFLRRLREKGTPEGLSGLPLICAIGPSTAAMLEAAGLVVSLVPEEFVAEGVIHALSQQGGRLSSLSGMRILMPRAREARDVLPHALKTAGALVDVVPCYENALPQVEPDRLRALLAQSPDLLVFTSSSAVRNFVTLTGGEPGKKLLADKATAALGPITARTLASYGKEADIVPQENTIVSLIKAIARHYRGSDPREEPETR